MTRPLAEEILELISEISNLEGERDSLRDAPEKAGVYAYQIEESIRDRWRRENEGKLRRLEDLVLV